MNKPIALLALLLGAACSALPAQQSALTAASSSAQASSSQPLVVNIDARQTFTPVSPYEHGMFIEHLGLLVYRSLWAEMLDDRKFYYPITSTPPAHPAGPGFFRMLQPRRWTPVGPDSAVTLDPAHPFVGAHSPRIQLAGSAPRGIRQQGLALVKGKLYTGRIYLRATPGVAVKVTLSWGPGANERQSLTLSHLTHAYRKFPLRFTAGASTTHAALLVTGTGTGNFHIGTLSLMPADNIDGFRRDTISLLRQLHSGFWRLPGGNFISDFNWYDSIGNRDRRPPVMDYAWHTAQPNDVGMDEFMTLCRLLGVQPYITVNAGFGDAHSAAEEVEYMNAPVTTRLGALRAHNGHPAPYHVKFWDIGNEPYGTWQLGHTDLKYYVLKHNEFAKAMRKADPSITLLASGAMPDEMTIEGMTRAMHLKNLQAQFGSPADWTGGLLAHCWGNFDGLTEHWYSRAGYRFVVARANLPPVHPGIEPGYVPAKESLLQWVRHPSNRVQLKAEEWHEYEHRFPAMLKKHIFLSIDEYAYTGAQPDLKSALAYGMVFNEMLRHTDFLRMSAFTMGVSTLDFNQTAAVFNANGLLFKLYGDHFGTVPVALSGNSPQPAPMYPPGGDQPRKNAGSPTYPLDMVAALTADHKFLTVAVVNATRTAQQFHLNLAGATLQGTPVVWRLSGPGLDSANHVGQSPQVAIQRLPVSSSAQNISVAPISVDIFRFPVSEAQ